MNASNISRILEGGSNQLLTMIASVKYMHFSLIDLIDKQIIEDKYDLTNIMLSA
jgi:hypothetical protein